MLKVYLEERAGRIKGRREKRKQGRIARTRRQILRYSILSALLFAGVAGFLKVSWSVADPETDIKVAGNQVVTAKQVRRALYSCLQKPIYALNPRELEEQVQTLPDVHRAFVRRYLFPRPHLIVQVMEEFPWASFAHSPEEPVTEVISQTGRFIPLSQFPGIYQPELKIYGTEKTKLDEKDVANWSNWVSFIQAQTNNPVEYVDMRQANCIEVKTGDLQLRLGAADSMLSKRLNRLSSVLPVLATVDRQNIEYVDLSLDSNVPLKISKTGKKEELIKGQTSARPTIEQENRSLAQQSNKPLL